jgi:hypothetical protein
MLMGGYRGMGCRRRRQIEMCSVVTLLMGRKTALECSNTRIQANSSGGGKLINSMGRAITRIKAAQRPLLNLTLAL